MGSIPTFAVYVYNTPVLALDLYHVSFSRFGLSSLEKKMLKTSCWPEPSYLLKGFSGKALNQAKDLKRTTKYIIALVL